MRETKPLHWPSDYVSSKAKLAYWQREAAIHGDLAIGHDGVCGTRWRHGPFFFEKYTTDEEPPVEPDGPRRYVIWQPLTRTVPPPGWGVAWFNISMRSGGVARLTADYEKSWASMARRHLKRWRAGAAAGEWRLVPATPSEFIEAFSRAVMRADLKDGFRPIIGDKQRFHPGLLRLWLAVRADGVPLAGLAVLDVPEADQSMHLIAFTTEAGHEAPAGVGLMAEWFETSLAKGYKWLDLGNFWAPGEPKSWQGFSRFKSQFVTDWLMMPKPFTRKAGTWRATPIFGMTKK
jgi:hypothetical protein